MRLLMTADTVGGVWTYATELAGSLAEHNVEIGLATLGRPLSREQHEQVRRLENVTLFESSFRLEWMHEPWEDVALAGRWLLEIREEFEPDLVHLNAYSHGGLEWNLPVLIGAHSCVLSWWQAVNGCAAPREKNAYRRAVTAGLRAADVVVAPTREMANCISQNYDPQTEIIVIPNGRTPGPFAPGPKHPFIFSAGRMWDRAKNLAALDEAAADLPWRVYVAGSIEHPEGAADGIAPARHARTFGALPVAHLAHWLSRADIYAFPARYEPFGFSVLEAALAECALVLGDIPSLRENWDEAAVFVTPNDPVELHESLRALIHEPARRRRLAAIARSRAMALTPQKMAASYMRTYRRLLRGRDGASPMNAGSTHMERAAVPTGTTPGHRGSAIPDGRSMVASAQPPHRAADRGLRDAADGAADRAR